jgi:hypothetical protein
MKRLHRQFATVPFLIVGKEISQEDLRIGLENMSDRLTERPQRFEPSGPMIAVGSTDESFVIRSTKMFQIR